MVGLKASINTFLLTALIITLTINVATSCGKSKGEQTRKIKYLINKVRLIAGIFFSNAFESIPNAMTFLVPFDFVLMVTSGLFLKLRYYSFY